MYLNIDINSHLLNIRLEVAPPSSAGAIIYAIGMMLHDDMDDGVRLITIAKDPETHLGNEKKHGCLGYIGDYTTQYIGIIVNQYRDFFRGSPEYQSLLVMSAQGRHAAAHVTLQDAANIALRNTCGGLWSPMPWECLVTGLRSRWVFWLAKKNNLETN